MAPPKESRLTSEPDYQGFRTACRAALKELGIMTGIKFMTNDATGRPVVVLETITSADTRIDTQKIVSRIYEIADLYDIPAAVVPAPASHHHLG